MRYTIYLRGKHAPGEKDWIQGESVKHTDSGIYIWPNFYDSKAIFFPWNVVERVEQ